MRRVFSPSMPGLATNALTLYRRPPPAAPQLSSAACLRQCSSRSPRDDLSSRVEEETTSHKDKGSFLWILNSCMEYGCRSTIPVHGGP